MRNANLAFGILTWRLSWAHLYIINFQKPMQMCIKGVRVRYDALIISLCTLKGTVDWN